MKLYSGHQVFLTGLLCAAAGAALAYYTVRISSGDNKKTSVQAKAEDYLTENESFPLTNAVSQIPVSDTSGYTKDELQNILVYEKCNEAFGIYCKYYAEGNEVKGRDCCSSY